MYLKCRSFPDSVSLVQLTLLHVSLKNLRLLDFSFSVSKFLCSFTHPLLQSQRKYSSFFLRLILLLMPWISSLLICCRPLVMYVIFCFKQKIKIKQCHFPKLCNLPLQLCYLFLASLATCLKYEFVFTVSAPSPCIHCSY